MYTRKKTAIPRFSLPLCHRTVTTVQGTSGWDNVSTQKTCVCLEAQMCTVQKKNTKYLDIDFSGISTQDVYWIFTNTPLYTPEEGTGFIGSCIYIPDVFFGDGTDTFAVPSKGGWYKVIAVDPCLNGVIPHYEAFIAKDSTVTDTDYPTSKESLFTDLTRSEFLSGSWVTDWTGTVTLNG